MLVLPIQFTRRFRITGMETAERKDQGFTLVELLVTMVISAILMVVVSQTFLMQQKTYDVQRQMTDMVQGTRAAFDVMTREIRMAGYNPTGATFPGICYHPGLLHFRSDLNGDGDAYDADEAIIYQFDSANSRINRIAGGETHVLAENIQQFSFDYLKTDGSAATATADISQVKIMISGRTEKADSDYAGDGGHRTYALTTVVTPENLYY